MERASSVSVSYLIILKINTELKFTSTKQRVHAHFCVLQAIKFVDYKGPVYSTAEEFINAALFLPLGLPSTLIRQGNVAFRKRSKAR